MMLQSVPESGLCFCFSFQFFCHAAEEFVYGMIKTIGVLTSGGDAPGMNAAVRAVVRAALKKGMNVYGVKRGYCGLIEDDIEPLNELSVAGIIQRGGTMLYTIGYDTAMNTAMELMDKLSDTSQSHYRCSVVEVMGRGAGYIAVNTGVASGALEIITKEMPYDLDKIAKKMLEFKARGKQNFIIVVAENIGHADEIAKLLQEKTGIESRSTILGHVQRGGSPTVRDRVVATEMGYYAVELLEQGIGNRVVGMQGGKIVDFDIQEALAMSKPYDEKLHHIAEDVAF